ncbi:MAG TPA: lysophospholipid acyltransferase family protein [Actinomycetota bacterium]|jgi:1-acyl-sn-glycerol-3-phosphate acyltransferase
MSDPPSAASDLHGAVLRVVGQVLGRDGHPPADTDALSEIGFDSLAYAELAAALEAASGIDLLDAGLGPVRTVGDLVAAAERAAADPGAGDPLVPPGLGGRQHLARSGLSGMFGRLFDLTVVGADLMPDAGPVVLCMNHESMLDVPAVAVASPRPITFMAKRELFRVRAVGWGFQRMGAFSVDRDLFDLRAVQIGLDVVRRGEVLGMFPEGTRTPGRLLEFLAGAPWIALSTGAPLLPCAIAGTERALPRGSRLPRRVPITVTFLPPIDVVPVDEPVKRRAEAERLASDVHDAIRPHVSY